MADAVPFFVRGKLFICSAGFYFFALLSHSQQTVSTKDILLRIASLQVHEDDLYSSGMFKVHWRYRKAVRKNDNAIFFTAISLYTLQQLKNDLPADQQEIADSIIEKGMQAFDKYRHPEFAYIYNFWPTQPPVVFPNIRWLNKFNKKQPFPFDIDDTVIMLMAMQAKDSVAALAHNYAQQFVNLQTKRIRNTFRKYRNIPAYSTWLDNKMPIAFDACVLSNVLYFTRHYRLSLQKPDMATIDLLRQMIINREYLTCPEYISPDYHRSPIIIYHFARLLGRFSIPALDSLKFQLISDTRQLFLSSGSLPDKILLNTSLMRLGAAPETDLLFNQFSFRQLEETDFYFFLADMATYFPNPFRKMLASSNAGKFYFYCPAYNDVLLLEYLIEQKKYNERHAVKKK